jgi:hypothetical protein
MAMEINDVGVEEREKSPYELLWDCSEPPLAGQVLRVGDLRAVMGLCRALLALHKPVPMPHGGFFCAADPANLWERCETVRAIARALDVPMDEGDQQ